MKNIELLIVDDEPLAHKVLESYCNQLDFITVKGHCYDGTEVVNYLNTNHIDAILLDIQMPDLTGMELLEFLDEKNGPKIIFTTAYSDFALEGFSYDNVVDFLLKPIKLSRFLKSIRRLKHLIELETNQSNELVTETTLPITEKENDFIILKEGKKTHNLKRNEILFFQSYGNYVKVILESDRLLLIRSTMTELLTKLPSKSFAQVHKSYTVNLTKVLAISGNLIELKEHKIPIGISYREFVKGVLFR